MQNEEIKLSRSKRISICNDYIFEYRAEIKYLRNRIKEYKRSLKYYNKKRKRLLKGD